LCSQAINSLKSVSCSSFHHSSIVNCYSSFLAFIQLNSAVTDLPKVDFLGKINFLVRFNFPARINFPARVNFLGKVDFLTRVIATKNFKKPNSVFTKLNRTALMAPTLSFSQPALTLSFSQAIPSYSLYVSLLNNNIYLLILFAL
jgi:hypothetical protein